MQGGALLKLPAYPLPTAVLRALHAGSPGGVILAFHALTDAQTASSIQANVDVEEFDAVTSVLCRFAEPVPVSELLDRHDAGKSTRGLFSVTFDDAYESLLRLAAPILVQRRIRPCVFTVSSACATGARYWWDRISDLHPRVSSTRWKLFEESTGLPDAYRNGQDPALGPLQPLRQWMLRTYLGRLPDHVDQHLSALEEEAKFRTPHRAMSAAELVQFQSLTGAEIGVHTVSHPVLPLLPDDELATEITTCHRDLAAMFGHALNVVAAPYGLFDLRTLRTAHAARMRCVVTVSWGPVMRDAPYGAQRRMCITSGINWLPFSIRATGVRTRLAKILGRGGIEFPEMPSATR